MSEIIYYNGGLVRHYLMHGSNASLIEPFIVNHAEMEGLKTLLFGLGAWDSLFDRSGALQHPLRIKNLRPMPEIDHNFNANLLDVCLQRASEIQKMGKKIRLFWSGGIDSTLALVSMVLADVSHDQLEVIYNSDSVSEYPEFLSKFLPSDIPKIQVVSFPHHNFVPNSQAQAYRALPCIGNYIDPSVINVTGSLGDKLFNSHTLLNLFGYHNAFESYRKIISRELYEATISLVSVCPLPINTIYDFTWWIYFNLYYQDELLQILGGIDKNNVYEYKTATCAFFDGYEFQQWSYHNRDRVATSDQAHLKYQAKQIIRSYTLDEEYCRYKLKQGSLKFRKTPYVEWDRPILFILENGEVVRDEGAFSTFNSSTDRGCRR